MKIIRSKKTIARLNNQRFFNPIRLIAIAEQQAKANTAKSDQPQQLDLFLEIG